MSEQEHLEFALGLVVDAIPAMETDRKTFALALLAAAPTFEDAWKVMAALAAFTAQLRRPGGPTPGIVTLARHGLVEGDPLTFAVRLAACLSNNDHEMAAALASAVLAISEEREDHGEFIADVMISQCALIRPLMIGKANG